MTTTTDLDAAIGARVHHVMWPQRITQKRLAAALDVEQSTVSKKLRGSIPWSAAEIVLAAKVLGCPPGDLLPRLDSNQEPDTRSSDLNQITLLPRLDSNQEPTGNRFAPSIGQARVYAFPRRPQQEPMWETIPA
jgi:transcriptional regulator with XRE-family HTH domain